MSLIDELIEVDIKHTSNPIARIGLNTLLIIGNSKKQHRVRSYSNMAEVRADYAQELPEYKCASLALSQDGRPSKILIGQVFNNEKFVDAYISISKENNDFYGVIITSKKADDQLAIAELVEVDQKLFGCTSNDKYILVANSDTHVLHKAHSKKYQRSIIGYHGDATSYPEAAWMGLLFSYETGSATWAFKALRGIKPDNLTTSEREAITLKCGNYFISFGANNIAMDGRCVSGQWIDIVQGIDWLTNTLKVAIANVFTTAAKVPYTTEGIAILENMIRFSLSEAAKRQIIDTNSIEIFVPKIADIAPEVRGSRILPDVRFEARLTGAVHKVKISGTVSV